MTAILCSATGSKVEPLMHCVCDMNRPSWAKDRWTNIPWSQWTWCRQDDPPLLHTLVGSLHVVIADPISTHPNNQSTNQSINRSNNQSNNQHSNSLVWHCLQWRFSLLTTAHVSDWCYNPAIWLQPSLVHIECAESYPHRPHSLYAGHRLVKYSI